MRLIYLGFLAIIFGFFLLLVGGAQAGIFLVFPFIISSGIWAISGALLMFVGFIMIFLDILFRGIAMEENGQFWKNTEKRGLGIVLIGPIPLLIDTKNRKLTMMSAIIFLILVLVLILIYLGALT